jgi:hypothetical protein
MNQHTNYVLRIPLVSLEILHMWLPPMENEHNSVNYVPWENSLAHQLRVLFVVILLLILFFIVSFIGFIHSEYVTYSGPCNSVGIATGYELDSPGIESQWGQDFLYTSRPALEPT